MYYFAYGTNLNKKIFFKKFKGARVIKKYNLKNFKIVFRLKIKVPDLQPMRKSKVPGLIYKINRDIENKLDKYDYPKLYTKNILDIIKKNYYYIKKVLIKKPTGYYFKIMKEGYRQNNFKLQIDL